MSLIHREAWFPGGLRIPQNQIFFWKMGKIIQNAKTQKHLEMCQNKQYTLQPEVSNPAGSVVSTMFLKEKSAKKTIFFCAAILDNFQNKNVEIWDHFFPLLFPKDSESLKILDIRLWEVGAKTCLNGTSKVNTQTDRQTDRQTDISTHRNHRPRGPMLWKLDGVGPVDNRPSTN